MRISANFLSVVIYLKLCLTFWSWEKQILLLPLYNDSSNFAFKRFNYRGRKTPQSTGSRQRISRSVYCLDKIIVLAFQYPFIVHLAKSTYEILPSIDVRRLLHLISPLKALSQMNLNLVGSICGRPSIVIAHFVAIR